MPTKVEINRACIKLHNELFDGCCFPDILETVATGKKGGWCPSNLKLKRTAFCTTHRKECLGLPKIF